MPVLLSHRVCRGDQGRGAPTAVPEGELDAVTAQNDRVYLQYKGGGDTGTLRAGEAGEECEVGGDGREDEDGVSATAQGPYIYGHFER